MSDRDSSKPPPCEACKFCGCEPDDDFYCGHPDAGPMGLYLKHAAAPGGHCGPAHPKFQQHPGRNPDGSLKTRTKS